MQCESLQQVLMDVLYGEEVSPGDKKHFYVHLRSCESCRDEFLSLMETRSVLQQWRDIEPSGKLVLAGLETKRRGRQWLAGWTLGPPARLAWGHVAWLVILGVLALLVALNTEFRIGREGLVVRAGLTRDPGMDQKQVLDLLSYMIDESERRQSRAYAQALVRLQEGVEVRRHYDFLEAEKYRSDLEKRYLNGMEENTRILRQIAHKVYR